MEHLYYCLNNQFKQMTAFHEAIQQQQRAIIESDIDKLEDAILKEEKVLSALENLQKEKDKLLFELSGKLKVNDLTLSSLIELLKEKNDKRYKEFEKQVASVKDLAVKIAKINFQNKLLIEHSRNFIRETINNLLPNSKQILDRKI